MEWIPKPKHKKTKVFSTHSGEVHLHCPRIVPIDLFTAGLGNGIGAAVVQHDWLLVQSNAVEGNYDVNDPDTVDARNLAPVDLVNIPLFTCFYTSQVVVWDFFHQQYFKGLLLGNGHPSEKMVKLDHLFITKSREEFMSWKWVGGGETQALRGQKTSKSKA